MATKQHATRRAVFTGAVAVAAASAPFRALAATGPEAELVTLGRQWEAMRQPRERAYDELSAAEDRAMERLWPKPQAFDVHFYWRTKAQQAEADAWERDYARALRTAPKAGRGLRQLEARFSAVERRIRELPAYTVAGLKVKAALIMYDAPATWAQDDPEAMAAVSLAAAVLALPA